MLGASRSTRALRPLCRMQSTQAPVSQRYNVPPPLNIAKYQETGIPGLLSAEGLKNAYYARTEEYSTKLGVELTKHQLSSSDSLEYLISQYSKASTKKAVHNYAALLHNVNFAYSLLGSARGSITDIPSQSTVKALTETPDLSAPIDNPPTEATHKAIHRHFGSLLEFKTHFLNSANAINGDGFTWLIARISTEKISRDSKQYDSLHIVNTYNAGTPFDEARAGQLSGFEAKDPKNSSPDEYALSTTRMMSFSAARRSSVGNTEYVPILCVDASPKSWLTDYGVFGKKAYLEQWWRSVDWDVVEKSLPAASMLY